MIQMAYELLKSFVELVVAALICGVAMTVWLMGFAIIAIWILVNSPLYLLRQLSIKWQRKNDQQ